MTNSLLNRRNGYLHGEWNSDFKGMMLSKKYTTKQRNEMDENWS